MSNQVHQHESMQREGGPPSFQYGGLMQTTNTTVVVNQPQSNNNSLMPGTLHGTREWTTGLCGCLDDVGNCLFVCFCYSCALCDNDRRAGECCCLMFCCSGSISTVRTKVRMAGGIRGSILNDCIAAACCPMCVQCQLSREMTNMGIPR